jgi:hypothetical protein
VTRNSLTSLSRHGEGTSGFPKEEKSNFKVPSPSTIVEINAPDGVLIIESDLQGEE